MKHPTRMTRTEAKEEIWPALPLDQWQNACDTLHMWTQIVGKTRLELTPMMNQWWQVPLYVTPRGPTTSPIPYDERIFDAEFDFIHHELNIRVSDGSERTIPLSSRSVADFYAEYMSRLRELGIEVSVYTTPVEVPDPIPFEKDTIHASYDPEFANRFWRILVQTDTVLKEFRAYFTGKSSPVHFFWGSFDMAVTRFSGRPAPVKPDADRITREAYSHEVISCGFWPGDTRFPAPAFYTYSAPAPQGFDKQRVRPDRAFYSAELGEFLLKYDDVRAADSPRDAIFDFAQSTYEAGARLAGWDRQNLEREAA